MIEKIRIPSTARFRDTEMESVFPISSAAVSKKFLNFLNIFSKYYD